MKEAVKIISKSYEVFQKHGILFRKAFIIADDVEDKASANSRTSLVMQENHVLCLLTDYLLKIGQLCSN